MDRVRRWDAAVLTWVLACVVLAVWIGIEVSQLRSLTRTLDASGRALTSTADGLESISGAPFVGDDIAEIAARVRETASTARTEAGNARSSIATIAILVAVAIFAIAVVPPCVAYLGVRRAWTSATRHERTGG